MLDVEGNGEQGTHHNLGRAQARLTKVRRLEGTVGERRYYKGLGSFWGRFYGIVLQNKKTKIKQQTPYSYAKKKGCFPAFFCFVLIHKKNIFAYFV